MRMSADAMGIQSLANGVGNCRCESADGAEEKFHLKQVFSFNSRLVIRGVVPLHEVHARFSCQ